MLLSPTTDNARALLARRTALAGRCAAGLTLAAFGNGAAALDGAAVVSVIPVLLIFFRRGQGMNAMHARSETDCDDS
jgi:hypothetical protein